MKFVPYHLLDGRPSVILDGSPAPGTVLTVTHWPGYPPPAGVADDLSAQMAFRLLSRPDLVPAGAEAVSNNHFDQDGLVSIYALTQPEHALAHRELLEDLAAAGDFGTFRHRDAARASMVIAAQEGTDEERYERMLGVLPDLLADVDRWRDVWAEEDAQLDGSLAALASRSGRTASIRS